MTSTENRIRVGRSISTLVYPPCFSYRFNFLNNQLNMNARMQKLKISPLIRSANQWTGFYMITAPAMKELKEKNNLLKIRPLDLENKMNSTPNKVFKNTNERTYDYLCYSCYFANSFTLKRYPILRGG